MVPTALIPAKTVRRSVSNIGEILLGSSSTEELEEAAFTLTAVSARSPARADFHLHSCRECCSARWSVLMTTFRPLHDRVLIRRIEAEERTPGGIIIPDTAKEKPVEGEVLAVGTGTRDDSGKSIPLDVKVGDRVLFGKWSGTEVLLGGEDRLIMKESDILGVIEPSQDKAARAA
jgi:chaperonin GroES